MIGFSNVDQNSCIPTADIYIIKVFYAQQFFKLQITLHYITQFFYSNHPSLLSSLLLQVVLPAQNVLEQQKMKMLTYRERTPTNLEHGVCARLATMMQKSTPKI